MFFFNNSTTIDITNREQTRGVKHLFKIKKHPKNFNFFHITFTFLKNALEMEKKSLKNSNLYLIFGNIITKNSGPKNDWGMMIIDMLSLRKKYFQGLTLMM